MHCLAMMTPFVATARSISVEDCIFGDIAPIFGRYWVKYIEMTVLRVFAVGNGASFKDAQADDREKRPVPGACPIQPGAGAPGRETLDRARRSRGRRHRMGKRLVRSRACFRSRRATSARSFIEPFENPFMIRRPFIASKSGVTRRVPSFTSGSSTKSTETPRSARAPSAAASSLPPLSGRRVLRARSSRRRRPS